MKMRMTQLKTIADIQTGPFGSQLHKEDYVETGTPIVTVEHLGNRVFTEQNLPRVSDSDKARLIKYTLSTGDIVFSRVGSVDRCSYVDKSHDGWMFSGRCLRVRPTELVDSLYLYYYFCLEETKQFVRNIAVGATMPSINTKLLGEVEIALPDLNNQKRIAAVLSSLDDKIENNQKLNDNLQQQLFSLYENMATASPCLKEYTLSNLCDFQEGYVNPPQTHPEYFDGEVKWLRAVDINESFIIETSRTLTKAGFESAKKSALLFEPNTIAISKSGTIGRLGIIADYMCGNRAVINIAPHDTNMLAFIYCFLKSKQREFPDMAVGSVQKNLYVSLLEPLSVSIPDNESLTAFNAVGASILGMIHNNCVENTDLANLRDTILPKLMSGEIDVSSVLL